MIFFLYALDLRHIVGRAPTFAEFIAAFIGIFLFWMSAQGLPVNLLTQFVPRPPIEYEKPVRARKIIPMKPMNHLISLFEDEAPPREAFEAPQDRKARIKMEKKLEHELELDVLKSNYKPSDAPHIPSDPYKTLFVGRLAYETTERTLRRVFEEWGRVKDIKMICDKEGRSRGYAFIEYEDERDLKDAYKYGDGIKIDGRHVLVDVERGRTVPGWLPRRLGGGRGPGRVGFDPRKQKRGKQNQSDRRDLSKHRRNGNDSYQRPSNDRKRGRSPRRDEYRRDSKYSSRKSSYDY